MVETLGIQSAWLPTWLLWAQQMNAKTDPAFLGSFQGSSLLLLLCDACFVLLPQSTKQVRDGLRNPSKAKDVTGCPYNPYSTAASDWGRPTPGPSTWSVYFEPWPSQEAKNSWNSWELPKCWLLVYYSLESLACNKMTSSIEAGIFISLRETGNNPISQFGCPFVNMQFPENHAFQYLQCGWPRPTPWCLRSSSGPVKVAKALHESKYFAAPFAETTKV